MHHYPLAKGDPLCPLGFHPQVRWPTRCKRCFRDYKEHGGRKKEDDFTSSTPALSSWNSPASRGRDDENGAAKERTGRSWSSSQNLSSQDSKKEKVEGGSAVPGFSRSSASWTSTPDLNEVTTAVTVSLKLPKRRQTAPLAPLDTGQPTAPEPAIVTLRRPSASPPPAPAHLTINKNDSLAERVRKMQLFKAQNSFEKEASQEKERQNDRRSSSRSREEDKTSKSKEDEKAARSREDKKDDVNFLIQVKHARNSTGTKPPVRGGPSKDKDGDLSDDDLSTTGTTTTEGTLVDGNVKEYQEQIESLKQEVDILRKRCERVEKEKSDILLRRLANLDTGKTGRSSDVLKLQQKVNELTSQNEDLRDEKKSLSLKIKEVEAELESRPNVEKQVEQLRAKLLAAETLCEELMDENEDMKKELRDLEEEIEEMQDNFREDQADEYSSLRRELEQSIKNCRVLSFKLKKTERRADQLEQEKAEQEKKLLELAGGQNGLDRVARIKELEQELSRSNEVALRLQRELQEATSKLNQPAAGGNQRRNPTLAVIGKSSSGEGKVSRASLTRGGSQEDPQQLLRDLQDSLEREADLREQLRNAEEEANNLRKTASRVEDDNESLVLQLKKMATKARTRKLSPTPPANRLAIENSIEKDEGISDEEDPAELRILLELNEQEAAVLRRKVEELEQEGDSLKRQVKELTEKISISTSKPGPTPVVLRKGVKPNLADEKVKVLEEEIAELRKKLIEKERSCERLHAEISLIQSKPKASLNKSKSLDGEQQNVDLKRQLQVIEQEANVLRSKTHALESDNEKLQAENKKLQLLRGTKSLKSEKSLEVSTEKIGQLEMELKEALTKIKELETKEKEEKPEKRVSFGGVVTKKDVDALKVKQEELDKMKLNFTKLEKENAKLKATLKELKEDAIKSFKPRTAKKLTDLTTKLQMKKMVEDLENEIGEMFVIMKNADVKMPQVRNNEITKLEKDIEEIRSKLTLTESELTNEKNRLQTEIAKLKDLNVKLEKDKSIYSEKAKKFEEDKNNALEDVKSLRDEKKKLEGQIDKLSLDLKNSSSKQSAMSDCMKKIEDLKKEMDEKDKEVDKLKKQVETMNRLEQDKAKLLKETGDKAKKILELEKKLKESEEKIKRTEKQLVVRKDRVTKLEKELSEEKEQFEAVSNSQRRLSVEWITEKDDMQAKLFIAESKFITLEGDMKEKVAENQTKILTLESHLAAKEFHIKQLEETLRETSNQKYDEAISSVELAHIQEKLDNSNRELEVKEKQLSVIKEEMAKHATEHNKLKSELSSLKADIEKLVNDKKELDNNVKIQKKESVYWESKASEFETDLQAERKKVERMRVAHDKDSKNKEVELATLKGKLRTLEQTSGAGTKKISELKQEFEENVKKLEHSLAVERAEYEELTGKYELLEEEHVVTKAKLTIEKEAAQGELLQVQKELNVVTISLRSLQETYTNQTDVWVKEKIEMQEQIAKLQERLCGGGWEVEKARLQARLDKSEREARQAIEQRDVTLHQQEALKRELEDARQKLDDYEKVQKVQRNQAAQSAEMEREMATLQSRLEQAERARRGELADCKMRYDAQMQSMQDELQSLQNQVSRFRRERDTYKQMLEQAHKNMQDLKTGDQPRSKRSSISSIDEEEYRNRLAGLEQQVACLEDELCEARLAASKLKTELVSERSTAEVKLAEMQSRLNEYEEERLLSSGRSRVAGMATRMELAWQKERDEQQRLLQETSTLARDLRQTLFEVERERDKERLDTKRRIEQLKRSTEEETDENKKKVTELQCDLLELRDAHAKLRTTNEKLRRDKERHDREREQNKLLVVSLKRAQQEDDRKTSFLLETIDDLMKQSPDLFRSTPKQEVKTLLTPTPPRRNRSSKSRSREATPESAGEDGGGGLAATLTRLQRATDELKASRVVERQRRQANMRRAASTEPRDSLVVTTVTPRASNGRTPSLKKRSISLEQTTKEQGVIWKTVEDGSVSSMQSLDGDVDGRLFTMQRDTSLDSRLSGGSTQSDVLPASEKKKKKGLFGKLKQLTKSRSIDDQPGPDVAEFRPIGAVSEVASAAPPHSHSLQGSDSDMSAAGSRRDIRGRLSDMFHRKGQMSRGNSKDGSRELGAPLPERAGAAGGAGGTSAQRPLSRNSSSSNIPRADAQRSDVSSHSRAASVTPATKRKGK